MLDLIKNKFLICLFLITICLSFKEVIFRKNLGGIEGKNSVADDLSKRIVPLENRKNIKMLIEKPIEFDTHKYGSSEIKENANHLFSNKLHSAEYVASQIMKRLELQAVSEPKHFNELFNKMLIHKSHFENDPDFYVLMAQFAKFANLGNENSYFLAELHTRFSSTAQYPCLLMSYYWGVENYDLAEQQGSECDTERHPEYAQLRGEVGNAYP